LPFRRDDRIVRREVHEDAQQVSMLAKKPAVLPMRNRDELSQMQTPAAAVE
jgi:hypothetical protein